MRVGTYLLIFLANNFLEEALKLEHLFAFIKSSKLQAQKKSWPLSAFVNCLPGNFLNICTAFFIDKNCFQKHLITTVTAQIKR